MSASDWEERAQYEYMRAEEAIARLRSLETVTVLCMNDYPVKVFERKSDAEQERDRLNNPDKREFWHTHEVRFAAVSKEDTPNG